MATPTAVSLSSLSLSAPTPTPTPESGMAKLQTLKAAKPVLEDPSRKRMIVREHVRLEKCSLEAQFWSLKYQIEYLHLIGLVSPADRVDDAALYALDRHLFFPLLRHVPTEDDFEMCNALMLNLERRIVEADDTLTAIDTLMRHTSESTESYNEGIGETAAEPVEIHDSLGRLD